MRRVPCIAAAPGAAIVVVDTALALALGNTSLFVPLLVIGPLAAAALASPRCTLGVALLAWRARSRSAWRRQRVLGRAHRRDGGGRRGRRARRARRRGRRRYEEALVTERAARRRSDFVARAGELLEAPPEPEAMLREIVRMAVPYMAELCIVDLVHDGELGETTAYATDPRTLEMLYASRTRYPLDAGGPHPVAVAARTGPPAPAARDRDRAPARLRRRRGAPEADAGRRIRDLAGGAADRPRADDRRAELHALRRRAALRRHRRRAGQRGRAPRRAGPRQRAAVLRAAAARRASSRRCWPTSPPP